MKQLSSTGLLTRANLARCVGIVKSLRWRIVDSIKASLLAFELWRSLLEKSAHTVALLVRYMRLGRIWYYLVT